MKTRALSFPLDSEYNVNVVNQKTRRGGGTKESEAVAGEQIVDNNTSITTQMATEEELVVEGMIENVSQVTSTSDFVNEGGKPVGIDTAIIRSIERYGVFIYVFSSVKAPHYSFTFAIT